MATYTKGFNAIVLTKEGAKRANELEARGIKAHITHMRIYRSPTAMSNLPHILTGNETSKELKGWACFPNHDTTFELIRNTEAEPGYVSVLGTLGSDIGTFSYDIAGLFLEDDTLFAIASTTRLLTKRKATLSSTANMQELTFSFTHETLSEFTTFNLTKSKIHYPFITELNRVCDLPKTLDDKERIMRISLSIPTTNDKDGYTTLLAHKLFRSNSPIWLLDNCVKLLEGKEHEYLYNGDNTFTLNLPLSEYTAYGLLSEKEHYFLSLTSDVNPFIHSVYRLSLKTKSKDDTGCHITFDLLETTLGTSIPNNTKVNGLLQRYNREKLYFDAVDNSTRNMVDIEYSKGRTFDSDDLDNPDDILSPLSKYNVEWVKLDGVIDIGNSSYDGRLMSNGLLQPIPLVPGSNDGMELRVHNQWIRPLDVYKNPTISIDNSLVRYGDKALCNIQLEGAKAGTQVAWYINIENRAFIKYPRPSVTGYTTLDGEGKGILPIDFNWGMISRQEKVTIGLIGYNDQVVNAILLPIQVNTYFTSDDQGQNRISVADEGTIVYLVVESGNTSTDANVFINYNNSETDAEDFDWVLPTYVELKSDNGYRIISPISIKNDLTTDGFQKLIAHSCRNSDGSGEYSSATLGINDTSLTPTPEYDMYFGYHEWGDPTNNFTVDLGRALYLVINAKHVPPIHKVQVDWSGSFDINNDAHPALPNPVEVTLINGVGFYPISGEVSAPTAPTVETRELGIREDRFHTYNIYDEYVSVYGTPPNNVEVTLTVYKDAHVVGTDVNSVAIDGTGNWGNGVKITVNNYGSILGRGGDGGYITPTKTVQPTNGGTALKGQDSNPLNVNNYGFIAGGGGGGAGFYLLDIWTGSNIKINSSGWYGSDKSTITQLTKVTGGGGRPLGLGGGDINSSTLANDIGVGNTDDSSKRVAVGIRTTMAGIPLPIYETQITHYDRQGTSGANGTLDSKGESIFTIPNQGNYAGNTLTGTGGEFAQMGKSETTTNVASHTDVGKQGYISKGKVIIANVGGTVQGVAE